MYWLERAFEERDPNLPNIGWGEIADLLREDPRFEDLLRRMNFPEDVIAKCLSGNQ